MKVLIDTHIFLWFISRDPQLSQTASELLESDIDVLLSVASLWEIAIKLSTGKLRLPGTVQDFIPQQMILNQIELLPITVYHLQAVSTLPFHHRDPFDCLIIAQSIAETLEVVSVDAVFDRYGVSRIQ